MADSAKVYLARHKETVQRALSEALNAAWASDQRDDPLAFIAQHLGVFNPEMAQLRAELSVARAELAQLRAASSSASHGSPHGLRRPSRERLLDGTPMPPRFAGARSSPPATPSLLPVKAPSVASPLATPTGSQKGLVGFSLNSSEPYPLVVVLGSINMDMTATASTPWPTRAESTSAVGEFRQMPGGKGANEAVAIARLGVRPYLIGRVGTDEQGAYLRKHLAEQGVDVSAVRSDAADTRDGVVITGTGVLIVTTEDQGRRPIKFGVTCAEANLLVGTTEVEAAKRLFCRPAPMKLLLMQLEIPIQPMLSALAAAKEEGVAVVFKPSPLGRGAGMASRVHDAQTLLDAGVDLCFVNEAEAPVLLGWDDPQQLVTLEHAERAAAEFMRRWPRLRTVVVTCGVAHVLHERPHAHWLERTRPPMISHVRRRRSTRSWEESLHTSFCSEVASSSSFASGVSGSSGAQPPPQPPPPGLDRRSSELRGFSDLSAEHDVPEGGGPTAIRDLAIEAAHEWGNAYTQLVVPRGADLQVVDVIGAADAYVGAFVAAALLKRSSGECLMMAHACGTISTRRAGAQDSLPSMEELTLFLADECPAFSLDGDGEDDAWSDGGEEEGELSSAPSEASDPEMSDPGEVAGSSGGLGGLDGEGEAPPPLPPLTRSPSNAHSLLHIEAMRANVHAVWRCLPSTRWVVEFEKSAAGQQRALPPEVRQMRDALREQLRRRDVFGLTATQRAYQCCLLAQDDLRFRTVFRHLLVAQMLLCPEVLLEGDLEAPTHEVAALCGSTSPTPTASAPLIFPMLTLPADAQSDVRLWLREGGVGAVRSAAALVVLSMMLAEAADDLTSEGSFVSSGGGSGALESVQEATARLLSRCICIVLQDDARDEGSRAMSTALLAASLPAHVMIMGGRSESESFSFTSLRESIKADGWTLLLAASYKGLTSIVRSLFDPSNGSSLSDDQKHATLRWPLPVTSVAVDGDAYAERNALDLAVMAGPSGHHRETCSLMLRHTALQINGEVIATVGGEGTEWAKDLRRLHAGVSGNALQAGRLFQDASKTRSYLATRDLSRRVVLCDDLLEQVSKQRPVVLKLCENEETAEREAAVLRMLNKQSRTAPKLLDSFTCDASDADHRGQVSLVLEEGYQVPLHSSVRAHTDNVMLQRANAFQLLYCVKALHEICGKVHCDLKPEHFLLFDAEFRLIDYGACVDEGTHCIPAFNATYASPEVARAIVTKEPIVITRAADVWACGLILHELFTGEPLLDESVDLERRTAEPAAIDAIVQERLDASVKLPEHAPEILRGMLWAQPEKRLTLRELLQRRFFRPPKVTQELQQVTLLAVFCSPTHAYSTAQGKLVPIRSEFRLNLEKEMRETCDAIPFRERELRPAARFEDIEEVIRGRRHSFGLSPRILHFSGHAFGEEGAAGEGNRTALWFLRPDGSPEPLEAERLIKMLRRAIENKMCTNLECVFLNACGVLHSLGRALHTEFPFLTVIGFTTRVLDKAALTFASGFYTYLGREVEDGRKGSIVKAFESGQRAWDEGGFITGDPDAPLTHPNPRPHGIVGILRGQLKASEQRRGALQRTGSQKLVRRQRSGEQSASPKSRKASPGAHTAKKWSSVGAPAPAPPDVSAPATAPPPPKDGPAPAVPRTAPNPQLFDRPH